MAEAFIRHHVLPGVFMKLPSGEQLLIAACIEKEIERETKAGRCPMFG